MPIYQEGLSDFRVGAMRQKMQVGVSQKVPSPIEGEGSSGRTVLIRGIP